MSVRKHTWTTKKGEQERWLVDYKDQKGKRRSKLFKRKKDADEYHSKTKVEVMGRVHIADRDTTTLAKAGELWLASDAGLERSTIKQREQHLNLHIVPFLGKMKLNEVTVPVVRSFLDKLAAGDPESADEARHRPRSRAMVRAVRTSLGSLLADAMEQGLSVRNAVRDMGRERRSPAKADGRHAELIKVGLDIPTVAEVNTTLAHAKGAANMFLTTAALTGMRASELRGLSWAGVDFAKGEITVRQRADMDNQIGSPKTKAGRRTIPIGKRLVNALREWKLACPKGELNLVFPTLEGNVMYHANVIKQWVHPPQIAAGVTVKTGTDEDGRPVMAPKYTGLHAFRHFYASFCINQPQDGGLGLSPKVVQHRLGHSSIQMTLDVYGHLFPRGDATDLDNAEDALLG
ncbi:integrase [Mesorhizobium loti NZP2037]|nr:site-specific integrase [Mesorhizobium loti]ANN59771.1 integrase [Mesorhizobium loti NZP2037]